MGELCPMREVYRVHPDVTSCKRVMGAQPVLRAPDALFRFQR
jgi:hypothetical protein